MMNTQSTTTLTAILKVDGTIHRVDAATRELTLLVNDAPMSFVMPPDCTIRVNGESAKLRLLQPRDRAAVAYSLVENTPFVHSIQVGWLSKSTPSDAARHVTKHSGADQEVASKAHDDRAV